MVYPKKKFIERILTSKRRLVIPVMTSPGISLLGLKPSEVFKNGELQFSCIQALAKAVQTDAVVTAMDLSVEAEAFGAEITFSDHENPTVSKRLVSDEQDIDRLAIPAVGTKRTAETLKCARLCAENIGRPTFGGVIGPFSLSGRLADMTDMMMLAATEPEVAHKLLTKATKFLTNYLIALKQTGIAGVIIAEPAAGLLSPDMCQTFAADYIKQIITAVQDESFLVVLHNCGKTEKQVDALLSTGADALHVGNAVNILDILPQVPTTIPVMGNLDPVGVLKTADSDTVYSRTTALLEATAAFPNYVLSSGCDVPPGVPLANVQAFLKACSDYNSRFST